MNFVKNNNVEFSILHHYVQSLHIGFTPQFNCFDIYKSNIYYNTVYLLKYKFTIIIPN